MIRVSIDKRPNGTYRARWRESPGAPQRTQAFKTARAAAAFKATTEADSLRGIYVAPDAGRITVVQLVAEHIDRQTWRYNTQRNARYAIEHVRRHFKGKQAGHTSTSDVQAFVAALSRDLEPRTVESIYRFLRQALRAAHNDGIVGRDVCRGVKLPRHAGGQIAVPTEDEVRELHRCAPADFSVAVVLAAGVGLRVSEVAGLTVDRVDFLGRQVTVDRQWHGRLDRFEAVKYAASNRRVPVGAEVLAQLAHHIAEHGTGEHGVLLHADGRPLNSNRMAWRWERTAGASDSRHTMHDLRHHYASSLIAAGCSIVAVQRALGHSKPSVTLDVYGHLMPSDTERIRDAAGRAWNSEDSVRTAVPAMRP